MSRIATKQGFFHSNGNCALPRCNVVTPPLYTVRSKRRSCSVCFVPLHQSGRGVDPYTARARIISSGAVSQCKSIDRRQGSSYVASLERPTRAPAFIVQ
jgi:hypothetical protein